MKKIIFLLVFMVGIVFYVITDRNSYANDYYDTVNKKFLSSDVLEDDEYVYNTFVDAQDKSDEVRDNIVKNIVSGNSGNYSSDIRMLYNNVVDIKKRNSVGIGPLKGYIDKVFGSKDIDELVKNILVVERELGVDIFTRISVDNDFLDNSKNIVYLYPVTFAFGSSADYFVDDDYMAYKAYIKRAIINLLEVYGMSRNEARFISSEIINFYTEISSGSKLASYYEDVSNYYNIVDSNTLSDVYTKFDVVSYLKDRGINEYKYSLVDIGQYEKINDYLIEEYLDIWKSVVLVKILSSYASYMGNDYRNVVLELNNSLTGVKEVVDLEEEAIELVSNVYYEEVDRIYEKEVITEVDKTKINDMFNDIKKCFYKILSDNEWLSDDTKKKALNKLDAMKVYIGINEDNINRDINILGNSLVENVISINKSSFLNDLVRLEDNSDIKAMSEVIVNAYYSPMENAVYIPSSVMFLLDSGDSYYEKLGTIGMIIAHEITHGFDYNGSMFDDKGNLNNWWTDNDRDNYTKLKNKVSEYYSKFEVMDGKYINGDKTVNENIADMGALKIITEVLVDKGASRDEMKEMYVSFGKFWKSQERDDYAKLLLLNDSHSPNKYRVNAVLSLIDEFYDLYNVFPWNDMYVSNNNRVIVW